MNRLSKETSPYLKQHETNPVDWYAWGPEALERARREDKPILLSVGYSSCHWCHVMAHESFEDEKVARALNENFISIKVDREERPDLDQVYQNVAQAMTGGGGWPLTVFLMPDLRPFFGGTYFPPEDRYGRPGFLRLVEALSRAYRDDRASVEENAGKLTQVIRELETAHHRMDGVQIAIPLMGVSAIADAEKDLEFDRFLQRSAEKLLQGVDWINGGVGGAPKFPNTGIFTFLWRYGKTAKNELRDPCLSAVILTLTKMAQGGIFDQLGGGFSRYSVDDHWAVPHFEKMLYDNALLLQLYAEVLATDQIRGGDLLKPETRALFLETVKKTVEYLLREMKIPREAFYAAQDADSEGEEGKFFVWTPGQLRESLPEDQARAFELRYGVDESGNFENATTVLHQSRTVAEVSTMMGLSEEMAADLLRQASRSLLALREKRPRPGLDDKTLTSWSALMISALAFTSEMLRGEGADPDALALGKKCADAATEAMAALRTKAFDSTGALLATVQKGYGRFPAYLDDYAFLARAALDLSRVDPARAPELREFSRGLLERVVREFRDDGEAGYFFVSSSHEQLLARPKSVYDQAIPSGTAVALSLLLWHAESVEDPVQLALLRDEFKYQSQGLFGTAFKNPFGHGELLCAALQARRGSILIEGTPERIRVLMAQPEVLPKRVRGGSHDETVLWCTRGTCTEVRGDLREKALLDERPT